MMVEVVVIIPTEPDENRETDQHQCNKGNAEKERPERAPVQRPTRARDHRDVGVCVVLSSDGHRSPVEVIIVHIHPSIVEARMVMVTVWMTAKVAQPHDHNNGNGREHKATDAESCANHSQGLVFVEHS